MVPEASAFPRTLAASHLYRPVWVYSACILILFDIGNLACVIQTFPMVWVCGSPVLAVLIFLLVPLGISWNHSIVDTIHLDMSICNISNDSIPRFISFETAVDLSVSQILVPANPYMPDTENLSISSPLCFIPCP